jgi:four helix bundle protein
MSGEFFFEKLQVYQRSLEFAIKLCKIASNFPIKFSRIRDQLIGAGISVPLNLAEGSGRKSAKEKVNFYKISRTSIFEVIPIIEISFKLNLITVDEYKTIRSEATELSKMINGLIASL